MCCEFLKEHSHLQVGKEMSSERLEEEAIEWLSGMHKLANVALEAGRNINAVLIP
jgi:hypothetical protein